MNKKLSYKTKWRDEILRYFQTMSTEHLTAADVYEYFRANGDNIGMTTVYRQLDHLVRDGMLNKYTIEAGSSSCYEYAGGEKREKNKCCIHCKCEVCGRLIHLHCSELKELQGHLSVRHNFSLDPLRTVFYGICDTCVGVDDEKDML